MKSTVRQSLFSTLLLGVLIVSRASAADTEVRAWGDNSTGQLGTGMTGGGATAPVAVTGLTDVIDVAAGQGFSMALLSDGTVRAWGYNGFGQLGDGTTTNRPSPVVVNGLTGVKAIA